jgi:hypothetical protein
LTPIIQLTATAFTGDAPTAMTIKRKRLTGFYAGGVAEP